MSCWNIAHLALGTKVQAGSGFAQPICQDGIGNYLICLLQSANYDITSHGRGFLPSGIGISVYFTIAIPRDANEQLLKSVVSSRRLTLGFVSQGAEQT